MAERAGLRPGDTILEVNGTPFRAVTHEEALKVSSTFLTYRCPSRTSSFPASSPRYLLILAVPLTPTLLKTPISLARRYEREDSTVDF